MKKFLFVDLETTGLTPIGCDILEFAMIITDNKLNEIKIFSSPVHVSQYSLDGMNIWCSNTHENSGLIAEVKNCPYTIKDIENKVLDILEGQFNGPEKLVIAGNSVHFDKAFIAAHMPRLNKRLHHRIIDVSSFYESFKIYHGDSVEKSIVTHRALADIRDSIKYLKKYLERSK